MELVHSIGNIKQYSNLMLQRDLDGVVQEFATQVRRKVFHHKIQFTLLKANTMELQNIGVGYLGQSLYFPTNIFRNWMDLASCILYTFTEVQNLPYTDSSTKVVTFMPLVKGVTPQGRYSNTELFSWDGPVSQPSGC